MPLGFETRTRTLVRSLTWRIYGIILTVALTWFLTGSLRTGIELGVVYNVIRFVTHYFHDRMWAHVEWGVLPHARDAEGLEELAAADPGRPGRPPE